jgi:hypothetical protein
MEFGMDLFVERTHKKNVTADDRSLEDSGIFSMQFSNY